jgi:Ni/Fe-hydrogenase 1 B-type cytochrome subunit
VTHPAYRQAHPLPYVIAHWTHLLSMAVLAVTGLLIHWPAGGLSLHLVRSVHFTAMYVVLVGLVVRIWYAFVGKSAPRKDTRETVRDIRNFLPQPENRGQLVETVRYYLFMRPTHPPSAKYNPLQKAAYLGIFGLLLVQAVTGFALYTPALTLPVVGPTLAAITTLFGGLMGIRVLHYLLMWAFIVVTMVHVYLSVAEDAASLPLMFFYRETLPPEDSAEEPPAELSA